MFSIGPERKIEGYYGEGPFDYTIEMKGTGGVVGVTEVKENDFQKGVAQNAVQIESVLWGRKRKADEFSREAGHVSAEAAGVSVEVATYNRCFGIITTAKEWRFLECTNSPTGNPKFKLSHVYSVSYGKPTMEDGVQEILELTKWLLTEATTTVTVNAAAPASYKKLKT